MEEKIQANWRVTAGTFFCEAIDGEVTVMVYKDGSIRCTGHKAYSSSGKTLEQKSKRLGRKLECTGPECTQNVKYRQKLFSEKT